MNLRQVCACVSACMCVYARVHVNVCVCVYVRVRVCVRVRVRVCVRVRVRVRVRACACACACESVSGYKQGVFFKKFYPFSKKILNPPSPPPPSPACYVSISQRHVELRLRKRVTIKKETSLCESQSHVPYE